MSQTHPLPRPTCHIVPPWLIQRLTAHPSGHVADCAERTLRADHGFRVAPRGSVPTAAAPRPPTGEAAVSRQVSDAGGSTELPGRPVRAEGEPVTGDPAADEAYEGLGQTWQLFWTAFGRDSLDATGARLLGTVHYDQNYDNAFWDGAQMVFGDGDGEVFRRFTLALDVIGHELTHGVIEHTARLVYQGQAGALSESVSDVFGSLVRQRALGQDAAQADWLIGADLFTDQVQGVALRSMRAPGTAYDDDVLGRDPQPATMADYVETADDNGGVHINSGIPNHAFHLAATGIGGFAWERAGQTWYDVLTGGEITPECDFSTFAELTTAAARRRFGDASAEATAVRRAWEQVGVLSESGAASGSESGAGSGPGAASTAGSSAGEPGGSDSGHDQAAADTPVELIRSGGVAGTVRRTTFVPSQLDPADAEEWRGLLSRPRFWSGLAEPAEGADDFTYRVLAAQPGLDTTVREQQLPDPVRALVRRTLHRSEGRADEE